MLSEMSGNQITVVRGDLRERVELLGSVDWRPVLAEMIRKDTGVKPSNGTIDKMTKAYSYAKTVGLKAAGESEEKYIATVSKVPEEVAVSYIAHYAEAQKDAEKKKSWWEALAGFTTPALIIAGLFGAGYLLSNVKGFIPTTVKVKT